MSSWGKRILVAAVGVVVIGAILAWWIWPKDPAGPGLDVEELQVRVERLAEKIEALRETADKKVVIIRESVQAEVDALPPDGVADGLADELSRFRERGLRPERVGDP